MTVLCDLLKGCAFLGVMQSAVQSRAQDLWQTVKLEGLPKPVSPVHHRVTSRSGQCHPSVVLVVPQEITVTAHLRAALTAPPLPFTFPTHMARCMTSFQLFTMWFRKVIYNQKVWSLLYSVWEIIILLERVFFCLKLCQRLGLCWVRPTPRGEFLMQVIFRKL